jgi:hypothetical protein
MDNLVICMLELTNLMEIVFLLRDFRKLRYSILTIVILRGRTLLWGQREDHANIVGSCHFLGTKSTNKMFPHLFLSIEKGCEGTMNLLGCCFSVWVREGENI